MNELRVAADAPSPLQAFLDAVAIAARDGQAPGRPEGFHLQPPTEPCVNLSIYTARLNCFSRNLAITGLRGKMIAPLDFSIGEDFL